MKINLKKLELHQGAMDLELEPTVATKTHKWYNHNDEACGTLCMFISLNLLFHIESSITPNVVWKTFKNLFGNQDVMRGHHLENELMS